MAGLQYKKIGLGSGGGSVGKAVASDTRGPRFESRHRQIFLKKVTATPIYHRHRIIICIGRGRLDEWFMALQ